eukprot:202366-Lingulodinium_polyedra.AAC.1
MAGRSRPCSSLQSNISGHVALMSSTVTVNPAPHAPRRHGRQSLCRGRGGGSRTNWRPYETSALGNTTCLRPAAAVSA